MTRKLYSKDSNGGDAAVQKNVAIPAILMGVLCLLSSGIETFMSLDFTRLFLFIREDSMDQLRALLMGFVKVFSHDSAEQLVGLVIFIVILFLRKKQLSAIKYRDIAVLVIFFAAAVGLARFSAILNKFLISDNLSHMANVAVGEKTNAIAMFSAPVLVNWLGLGVFVLARTGAKKFARVAGGAVVAVALVLSVFGGI
ncbi:MAG: hypothetical protein IKZ19_09570, partial [Clostridia bacterium]|nr:hypothetical protein [Clostridia bacterium]